VISIISPIVVIGILIFVHELGHFIVAKWFKIGVLKFSLGFGPKIFGFKIGDTEYLISLIPLGGYVKMLGELPGEEIREDEIHKSFSHRPLLDRSCVVIAGPIFNILFAALIFIFVNIYGIPTLAPKVGEVKKGFPAYESGIKSGDTIVSINGIKVSIWEEISKIIKKNKNNPLIIIVNRDNRYIEFKILPKLVNSNNLFGEEIKTYIIGISPSNEIIIKRYGPFNALLRGIEQTWNITKLTILTIIKLIERVVPAKTLGGPILIAKIAGEYAKVGILNLLLFLALLSINLGILNLLPIPILDGGYLLLFSIEFILGRPLSMKNREIIQHIGFFLIMLLILFAFYNDIMRIFS
jgi:regulator of sigma E protease